MAKVVNISKDEGSLADQAYARIKKRIFDFDLMPGDRLSESELAEQIQVSRTPLRQALQRLQHEGFVQAMPKVGWLVPPLSFEKFDELYDFRVLIECFAVRELCAAAEERSELRRAGENLAGCGRRPFAGSAGGRSSRRGISHAYRRIHRQSRNAAHLS